MPGSRGTLTPTAAVASDRVRQAESSGRSSWLMTSGAAATSPWSERQVHDRCVPATASRTRSWPIGSTPTLCSPGCAARSPTADRPPVFTTCPGDQCPGHASAPPQDRRRCAQRVGEAGQGAVGGPTPATTPHARPLPHRRAVRHRSPRTILLLAAWEECRACRAVASRGRGTPGRRRRSRRCGDAPLGRPTGQYRPDKGRAKRGDEVAGRVGSIKGRPPFSGGSGDPPAYLAPRSRWRGRVKPGGSHPVGAREVRT